ncbi:MAG: hypothetical protein ABI899_09265 [Actinomycetota bacterium]
MASLGFTLDAPSTVDLGADPALRGDPDDLSRGAPCTGRHSAAERRLWDTGSNDPGTLIGKGDPHAQPGVDDHDRTPRAEADRCAHHCATQSHHPSDVSDSFADRCSTDCSDQHPFTHDNMTP